MPKPTLTEQIKVVVKTFQINWYLDEDSSNVRTEVEENAGVLLQWLIKKGFSVGIADDDMAIAASREKGEYDLFSHVELKGYGRVEERSYIEVLNPDLNDFIKESILGLGAERGR